MVIKNDSDLKAAYIGCPLMEIAYLMYCFINDFNERSLSLIIYMSVVNVVLLIMLPVVWRTVTLDKNGCTIKLFRYESTYSWHELNVKRLEKNKTKEWAFFSVKPINKK